MRRRSLGAQRLLRGVQELTSAQLASQKDPTSCEPLWRLPREILLMILRHATISSRALVNHLSSLIFSCLSRTCRYLYTMSRGLLWGSNHIVFTSLSRMEDFMSAIPKQDRSRVSDLSIRLLHNDGVDIVDNCSLRRCLKMLSLDVDAKVRPFSSPRLGLVGWRDNKHRSFHQSRRPALSDWSLVLREEKADEFLIAGMPQDPDFSRVHHVLMSRLKPWEM